MAKPSYKDYTGADREWNTAYDVARKLDPIDFIGNAFNFKNPLHGLAEKAYNGYARQGYGGSNVNRVRFDYGSNTGWSDADKEAMYNSLSPAELEQIGGMSDKYQQEWLHQRLADIRSGKAGAWMDPEEEEANRQMNEQNSSRARLEAFQKEMLQPLNMNDPNVKRIMGGINAQTWQASNNRGIIGDPSTAMSQRAMSDAALGMQHQRNQLGLQAIQSGLSDQQSIDSMRQRQYEYNTGMEQDSANQNWQWGQAQRQGQGAGIGGLIGAGIGYWKGGGWKGAQQGMEMGSQLGAGMSGLSGSAPPQYRSRRGGYGGYGGNRGGL